MKYLGVLTPFKGLRVYTRAAMGMPGSTEHLDELMCRVLGDMIEAGQVIKLADDLYLGAAIIKELQLSATKTEICPVTTILGWVWSAGTIQVTFLVISLVLYHFISHRSANNECTHLGYM